MKIRINKYLADKGVASRREADALIEKGRVTINGKRAVLGDKVDETDVVAMVPTTKKGTEKKIYFLYYKPAGLTMDSSENDSNELAKVLTQNGQRVYPVGRIEKKYSGLIVLTNDGRVTSKLQSQAGKYEKKYFARVNKHYSPSLLNALNGKTKSVSDTEFEVSTTEITPNILDVCGRFNFEVLGFIRTGICNLTIQRMKEGDVRELTGSELSAFLSALGLK